MAIAPIDLQTIYSQMDNIAQIASKQNVAQLNEAMQQQKLVQQDMEKAQAVREAAREEAKASTISDEGGGGASYEGKKNQQKKQEDTPQEKPKEQLSPLGKPWLGQHIDITG